MTATPRLVAYGHSWVAGEGASDPDGGFVALVARRVGAELLDRAVGGSSTRDTDQRVTREGVPAAEIYLVMAGLNDARLYGNDPGALMVYEEGLTRVLSAIRASSPSATVVGIQQPGLVDYSGYPPHHRGSDEAVAAHNAVLRRVCGHHEALAVTVPGWDAHTMLHADAVHPNDAGHERLADAVLTALASSRMATTSPVQD